MSGCDAACQKIIINTGFMAALAPVLAGRTDFQHVTRNSAKRLGEAARVHADMIGALGFAVSADGFSGCKEAQLLLSWIHGNAAADANEQMDKWTAEIWSAIADLAAGKVPTLT